MPMYRLPSLSDVAGRRASRPADDNEYLRAWDASPTMSVAAAEPEPESYLARAARMFGTVAGAPKRVVDVAASYYSPGGEQVLSEGLTPNVPTVGDLAKEAVFPEEEARSSYGKSIGREVLGFGADLAVDPLTYGAIGALGRAGKVGKAIETGAGIGFTGLMGMGAVESGKRAYEGYREGGFTPEVAGETTRAALEGVGAALGAKHAFGRRGVGIEDANRLQETRPTTVPETGAPVPDLGTPAAPPNPGARGVDLTADEAARIQQTLAAAQAPPPPVAAPQSSPVAPPAATPPAGMDLRFAPEEQPVSARDTAEVGRLARMLPEMAEDGLAKRLAFYESKGLSQSAEAVKAEIQRRQPVEPQPVAVDPGIAQEPAGASEPLPVAPEPLAEPIVPTAVTQAPPSGPVVGEAVANRPLGTLQGVEPTFSEGVKDEYRANVLDAAGKLFPEPVPGTGRHLAQDGSEWFVHRDHEGNPAAAVVVSPRGVLTDWAGEGPGTGLLIRHLARERPDVIIPFDELSPDSLAVLDRLAGGKTKFGETVRQQYNAWREGKTSGQEAAADGDLVGRTPEPDVRVGAPGEAAAPEVPEPLARPAERPASELAAPVVQSGQPSYLDNYPPEAQIAAEVEGAIPSAITALSGPGGEKGGKVWAGTEHLGNLAPGMHPAKVEYGLEDFKEGASTIAAALKRDKGNPLEMRAKAAMGARFAEEMARRGDAYEPPTGDASFNPDEFGEPKYSTRAFHGSKHDFDKFDSSKIGTGEGAQAYGHGLYFSGNKEVAEYYRRSLAGPEHDYLDPDRLRAKSADLIKNGWPADAVRMASFRLHEHEGRLMDAARQAEHRSHYEYDAPEDREANRMAGNLLRTLAGETVKRRPGHTYEVDLAPDEGDYLNWDKPLGQQSEKVKAALAKAGITLAEPMSEALRRGRMNRPAGAFSTEETGADLYHHLHPEPAEASAQLREAGIPGIKYLDQGSRGTGEGSHNYVLFDDSKVSVNAKYAAKPATYEPTKQGLQGRLEGTTQHETPPTIRTQGREGEGPLFKQEEAARIKKEQESQGRLFKAGQPVEGASVTTDHVKAAFKAGTITESANGWTVKLPGDRTIRVDQRGEIAYQPEAFEKGYGRKLKEGEEQIVGSFNKVGRDAIIQLAKGADAGTLSHESFHAAMDLALSPKEREAVLRHYKNEEAAADAYSKWKPAEKANTLFGKIREFFHGIYRAFRPSWESAFEATRSGKAYERSAKGAVPRVAEQAYAVAAKAVGDRVENFKRWFGESKVVNEKGEPVKVFHGTQRPDRLGTKFRKDRATSGPMPFFTEDPAIASKYAEGKQDTSIEQPSDYSEWFKVKPAGARTPVDLDRAWWHLSSEERQRISDNLPHVKYADEENYSKGFALGGKDEHGLASGDHWDYEIKQARGNVLKAAKEIWLAGGNLVNDEASFMDVLRLGGMDMKKVAFDDPYAVNSGVLATYLSIKNPLVADKITPQQIEQLQRAANRARGNPQQYGADAWDKSTRHPQNWMEMLRENPETAWTSIPDWVTRELRRMGYDGIKDTGGKMGGDKHNVWVPFEPTQIKSAIGNRGTFDPNNPDIRYATAPKTPPVIRPIPPKAGPQAVPPNPAAAGPASKSSPKFNIPEEGVSDRITRYIQDKLIRGKRTIEAVKEQGGKVDESNDFYRAEELFHGRTEERLRDAERKYADPLVKGLAAEGVDLKTLDSYLYAKHAPDRNAAIEKRTEGKVTDGSGMSNAEAQKILADFQARSLTKKLDSLAKYVRDARDEQLRVLEDGGLISSAQAKAWKDSMGDHYVPLRTAEVEGGIGAGQGFDIRGKEAKSATGRASRADSPTSFMLAQLQRAIVRAEKNKVTQTFAKFVEDNPDKTLWEQNVKHTTKQLSAAGKTEEVQDFRAYQEDLDYKVNGETQRITVKDPLLLRAMKNLSANETGEFVRKIGAATRLYSGLVTTYSPEFLFTNFARDIQHAAGNVTAEHGSKVAKSVVTNVPSAMKALYANLRDPNAAPKGKWGTLAKEFREDGGSSGFYSLKDPKALERQLESKVKAAGPGALPAARRAITGLKDWIEDANKSVENGTRLALYGALRDSGASRSAAASAAKNVTLNFNRKGEASPAIGSLYAFFNANIQGTKRLKEVVIDNPKGRAIGASIAALGAVMDLYNRANAGDQNKDGSNDYDAIPEYVKEKNIVIMRGEGKDPLLIPMPYGFNILHAAGRLSAAVGSGAIAPTKAGASLAGSLYNAFNPLGGEADFVQALTPTFLDPIVQDVTNKDFTGKPIRPEAFPGSPLKPNSATYFRNAPGWAKDTASLLNKATGGDKVTPGFVDVSPETIEHYWNFVSGGAGKFAGNLIATGQSLAKSEAPDITHIPVARRFVYEERPGATGQKYRKNLEELDTLYNRYKTYREEGDTKKAQSIPLDLLRAKRAIDGIDTAVRGLKRAAKAGRDVDAKIEALQTRANRIMAAARKNAGLYE